MKLTAGETASMVSGQLVHGEPFETIRGVSIDSRTLSKGELFVAIVGPRHDGHDHVAAALSRGASGIVCDRPIEISGRAVAIRVSDTTLALQQLASGVRMRSGARVVAITGSMGKTTTKEAAAAAIASRYRVLKSKGNLNNLYGLPLSLLALDDEEVAVVEMGMSEPGEIRRLAEIARPDVGLVVNVAEVHLEFFPSLAAIAEAKGELYESLDPDAVAVVNADDPLVLEQARKFAGRRVHYGTRPGSDLHARDISASGSGLRFDVDEGRDSATVVSKLRGRHNVHNLLAGLAAARALDVPLAAAAEALTAVAPASHRGERLSLAGGVVVIDESYNSNPRAAKCALDALADETGRRRVAVLGDMLELGERGADFHAEVGSYAVSKKVDFLMGVGTLSKGLVEAAREAGLDARHALWCADADEAYDTLTQHIGEGDVVLLKGSRSIGLDRVAARLARENGGAA